MHAGTGRIKHLIELLAGRLFPRVLSAPGVMRLMDSRKDCNQAERLSVKVVSLFGASMNTGTFFLLAAL